MTCRRVRPTCILKVTNKEALCLIKDDTGEDISEWIDVEKIDDDSENLLEKELVNTASSSIPLVDNLQHWLSSPWANDE